MPASSITARAVNDRIALGLLQEEGPLTAGQLKTLTGLSRPSVADLVERLQAAGLVSVVGEAGAERRGPNARLYGIVADRAHLAALDVRTGSVAVVVTDLLGAVLAEATLPVGDGAGPGPADAVEEAAALLERTVRQAGAARLHSVGIGAPGLIDPATGELRDSSGLPAWHRSLVGALQERLPATVLVENETNLAALAEQRTGAARGLGTFVLLWLGHGVGAALVLEGKLRRGVSGGAGRSVSSRCPAEGSRRPPTAETGSTVWPAAPRSARSPTGTPSRRCRRDGNPRRPPPYGPLRRRAGAARTSWRSWPHTSPSVPQPSWPWSTPAVWCWAARSATLEVRTSRPGWNGTWPPSPRSVPKCARGRSAARRCCTAHC